MALLRCQHRTLLELLRGKSLFPPIVRDGLVKALTTIDEKDAAIALSEPEHSKANFDNMLFERLVNCLPPQLSLERKSHVSGETRHENDFSIIGPEFAVSVEIEKGDRARFDLDIRKMESFARESAKSVFGVFIVPSNNRVDRSISGNSKESSFDYVCRTLHLLPSSRKTSLPPLTPREHVENALNLLKEGLEPFIECEMQRVPEKYWERSTGDQKLAVSRDVQWLLNVMLDHWNDVFASVLTITERNLIHEARGVRNRWTHQETFSPDDADRALDTAERLLRAVKATEQASALKRRKEDYRSEIFSGQQRGMLVDVLVMGYSDPKPQNETPLAVRHDSHEPTGLSALPGSRQTASVQSREIRATPPQKPPRTLSGIIQNTESLTLQELAKLLDKQKSNSVENSSAFRTLRETLLRRAPSIMEKLNPRIGYVGYHAASSDRAYIYVQPDLLVIDLRRPRTIESKLKNAGIDIIYRNNYQGQAGWTTGIRLLHHAPTHQIELVANEIIQALAD